MQQIPPLTLKEKYFKGIEDEINRIFMNLIYAPLISDLGVRKLEALKNSVDPLADAINDGRIYYYAGEFHGSFNARISKRLIDIGAKYSGTSKTYKLAALPPEISMIQAHAEMRFKELRRKVLSTLGQIDVGLIDQISDIPEQYMKTIDWIEEDFQKTVRSVTIAPKLTEAQQGILAAEWGQNLDLYVKDFTKRNVLELRQKVQDNAFSGNRASQLVKMIEENYGVSRRKAKFLARQETSLLVSKFREVKYKDMGASRYIWRGSLDERERHDHKILEGKIFSWDLPPVVDRKTGRRANPGEDFGCRCVAVAFIE